MLVSKIRIEGPIVKEVTRSGHGGHVIVPEDWIGKTVRVTIIDDGKQAAEEKIKTKQDLKNDYPKFKRHLRGAPRLARKNINLSKPSLQTNERRKTREDTRGSNVNGS